MNVYVLLRFFEYSHNTEILGVYTEQETAVKEANRVNRLHWGDDLKLDGVRYVPCKDYSVWYEIQKHEVKGDK